TLHIHLSNPNVALPGLPNFGRLTGVAFTDILPTGLIVATPSNLFSFCGGTATATAGSGSVSLSGGSLLNSAPLSACDINVDVSANGAATGLLTNTTGAVTSIEGGTGNTATATIIVTSQTLFTKSFAAPTVPLNQTVSLTFQ